MPFLVVLASLQLFSHQFDWEVGNDVWVSDTSLYLDVHKKSWHLYMFASFFDDFACSTRHNVRFRSTGRQIRSHRCQFLNQNWESIYCVWKLLLENISLSTLVCIRSYLRKYHKQPRKYRVITANNLAQRTLMFKNSRLEASSCCINCVWKPAE